MKNIIIILLICSLVFSFFPEKITGSNMVLENEYGSIPEFDQAFASYSNADASIAGSLQTDYVAGDYGSITDIFGQHANDPYTKTIEPGTTCYYTCYTIPGEDFNSGYCDMDCYIGNSTEGVYYNMWVVTSGGSEQLAYKENVLLATEITNFIYSVYTPGTDYWSEGSGDGQPGDNENGHSEDGTGNGVPDSYDDLDDNGIVNMNNTIDEGTEEGNTTCVPALILGLGLVGFAYRN